MYERLETEYFTAKRKAARSLGLDHRYRPKDLPSNAEIRDHIQSLASVYEGAQRTVDLRDMRLEALRLMRRLEPFHPALIGSVLTGHIRRGSDIDLHVFSDSLSAVTMVLDDLGLHYEVEHKRIIKHDEARIFKHVHVAARFPIELTVYTADQAHYVFKSSITGKAMERATLPQLEQFLAREYPDADLSGARPPSPGVDRFDFYRLLLLPLEAVKQNPVYHPEGDALYHSLQVFELARDARPYDEEFLLAALLHDVGKAIDPRDHVRAGLDALEGSISARTVFLIEHHMEAHAWRKGVLGHKAAQRLTHSEDWEDVVLLSELDAEGRARGMEVGTVDEALDYVRRLEQECG